MLLSMLTLTWSGMSCSCMSKYQQLHGVCLAAIHSILLLKHLAMVTIWSHSIMKAEILSFMLHVVSASNRYVLV